MDNLTREEEYRLKLAEKLMDLGNLIIVGLVIGLATFQKMRPLFAIIGMVLAIGVYIASYFLYTRSRK